MNNDTVTSRYSLLESASFLQDTSPLYMGLAVTIIPLIVWAVVSDLFSPLRQYPGPLLARFTRFWYMYQSWTGDSHLVLNRLHRKYGPIVRISPYIIDIDMPELVKTIYSIKGDWLKTEFYHGSSALVDGQIVLNIFSQTDPIKHKKERQPIARLYSSASIAQLEPHMDKIINMFCNELEKRFMDGENAEKVCDIGRWTLYYTWDVVGAVTFSKPIGYLEKGYDFDGTLHNADRAQDYFTIVGTMPFLDRVFDKNPICHIGPPGFNTITGISIQHLVDRYQGNDKEHHDPHVPDFLDKFIEVKNADPDHVNDAQIVSWLMVNMIAGADTTAIAIRSCLYYSLKNPRVWKRLSKEILAADFRGRTPPAYREVKALPYTNAVVNEALRMLPGVSTTMERYVPSGGYVLPNGDYLPAGTIVGMSPYILARNRSVYGEDSEDFRPERWLQDKENGETEEAFRKRLMRMNQADLSFGGGTRVCIGQHMGLFQVFKVLATLVTLYDMELADPEKEWKVTNSWFARQEGVEVKIRRRAV